MRVVLALVGAVAVAGAVLAGPEEPVFLRWLNPETPLDATIQEYWQRGQADQLSPPEWVDLGTMLFQRGFPADAIDAYRAGLKRDTELADGWFKLGLVYQKQDRLADARRAYRRCIGIRPGHGWANFYLGLLEERNGHPEAAVRHYRTAFRHAPELGDPAVNNEVLFSDLALAARIDNYRETRFELDAPLSYLEPDKVRAIRDRLLSPPPPEPTATPTPEPAPTPAPVTSYHLPATGGRADHGTSAAPPEEGPPKAKPYGVPNRSSGRVGRPRSARPTPTGGATGGGSKNGVSTHLRDVSPEARLRDLLPGLHRWLLPLDVQPA